MAGDVRYNKVIDLLEHGKPVFCSGLVWNGNLDDLTYVADADYDMVIMEMEHEGFSFNNLRTSLQFILNRKRISGSGTLQADPVPLVQRMVDLVALIYVRPTNPNFKLTAFLTTFPIFRFSFTVVLLFWLCGLCMMVFEKYNVYRCH